MLNVCAGRLGRAPTWLDSLLFLALMSGPPKFRDRNMTASLTGEIDAVVLVHIAIWACGALWVMARLSPSLLRWGMVPAVNRVQVMGALLIAGLSLSLWHSPGVLLTAFTLGQFTVMLSFAWLFADRFGPSTYLRHLFVGVCVLTLSLVIAAFLTPDVVITVTEHRFRGERIANTGAVAGMGLIFCLSNVPRLRSVTFWGAVGLFGVLLATSRMRTAYVGVLAYLLIGYVFGRGLRVRRLVPLLLVLSVGLLILDASAPTTDYIVRDSKSIESMSDRIPLWEHLTTAVMHDEPLIGFGYFAASRVLGPQVQSTSRDCAFSVLRVPRGRRHSRRRSVSRPLCVPSIVCGPIIARRRRHARGGGCGRAARVRTGAGNHKFRGNACGAGRLQLLVDDGAPAGDVP